MEFLQNATENRRQWLGRTFDHVAHAESVIPPVSHGVSEDGIALGYSRCCRERGLVREGVTEHSRLQTHFRVQEVGDPAPVTGQAKFGRSRVLRRSASADRACQASLFRTTARLRSYANATRFRHPCS